MKDYNGPKDTPDYYAGKDFERRFELAVKQARYSLPSAKSRFQGGLPAGFQFFVTIELSNGLGAQENAFISVQRWADDEIHGQMATKLRTIKAHAFGEELRFHENRVIDWTITAPDGSEEGNLIGKLFDAIRRERDLPGCSRFRELVAFKLTSAERDESGDDLYELFITTMQAVSLFGTRPPDGKSNPVAAYSGDVALFEMASYVFFRVDLWLFAMKPEKRDAVSPFFGRELVKLFSEVFQEKTEVIHGLLKERQDGFSSVVRRRGLKEGVIGASGWDIDSAIGHLKELLLRSRHAIMPLAYHFGEKMSPPADVEIADAFPVAAVLQAWEIHMITGIVSSVEQYCTAHNDGA